MNERRPAACRALGTVKKTLILLASLLPPLLAADNCHLDPAVQNVAITEASNKITYCKPAKGCTFIQEYHDCVRDNETPQCVYFSVLTQNCELCYIEKDPANREWPKPTALAPSSKDSLKLPPGAKLCETVPP